MGDRAKGRVGAGQRPLRDDAVSSVLGAVMMLAVLMTLVPGMILLREAVSAEMDAQREAAERAAWCARNPAIGPPTCDEDGPMPGYACTEVEGDAWLCTLEPAPDVGPERNVSAPTASPTPVVRVPTVTPLDPLP